MLTVKGIFKALLGVIVVTVLGTLIVEVVNTTTTSHYLQMTLDTSMNTACQYFSQESYKKASGTRGNLSGIPSIDGGNVSGSFYEGSSEEDIFNNLYRNSSDFQSFANAHSGTWKYLGEFFSGSNALLADNLVTPSNMGITYLDKPTIQRMARWNLTKLLANGYPDNIRGAGSNYYVSYKGFKVFTNSLQVTNIEYTEIPMTDFRFKEYTNLVAGNLGVDLSDKERATICVADVSYTVPISYVGITPIGKVTYYVSNKRVKGLDDTADTSDLNIRFNETSTNYTSGSNSNNTPVQGSIRYYIIR